MISSGLEGLSFTPELHSKIAMILKQVTENSKLAKINLMNYYFQKCNLIK